MCFASEILHSFLGGRERRAKCRNLETLWGGSQLLQSQVRSQVHLLPVFHELLQDDQARSQEKE